MNNYSPRFLVRFKIERNILLLQFAFHNLTYVDLLLTVKKGSCEIFEQIYVLYN